MDSKEIEIGNKIIGNFMGWEVVNINDEPEDADFDCWVFRNKLTGESDSGVDAQFYTKYSVLPFDEDWNLLMGAVQKIEDRGQILLFNEIDDQRVVKFHSRPRYGYGSEKFKDTKIQAVFQAVVEIIERINENSELSSILKDQ
jgi:hypothetical protein